MGVLNAVRTYHSLFGPYGVLLAVKARVMRRAMETIVSIPGIKHPVHVRLRTSDIAVLRQVLATEEYDSEVYGSPRTIVDAGANIGLTSIFYANKYPEAMILAIEPEVSNFTVLNRNVAPYSNIVPIRAALWKDEGELSVIDAGLGHYGFQVIPKSKLDAKDQSNCIPAVTVEKLMRDYGIDQIDILKVDIEGSEKEVFENSSPWIEKVGVLVVELHDRIKVGCARSVYLASKNFEVELHHGESIFFARRNRALRSSGLREQPDAGAHGTAKLRFRIVATV